MVGRPLSRSAINSPSTAVLAAGRRGYALGIQRTFDADAMFKQLWKTWTIDKPAAFGDWLWELFVVQLAALLNRLTLRRIIAIIPLVILIIAYAHRIPLPP